MTSLIERKAETVRSFQAFADGIEMPRWPAEIFLELSNVCDLKCAMCPTFSALNPLRLLALKETERGFLETGQIARPLEELLTHALNVHCFGYGEPTIHPAFRESIEYLAGFEVMIDFFTNGMHIDADLADFLVRSNVYRVTVSFSGATAEDYENVYLGGKFEQVLAGLRHLHDAKQRAGRLYPIVVINSLSFRHHIERLEDFVDLMAAHGVGHVEIKPLIEHGDFIPELAGHAAVIRPEVEGKIIERAKARAEKIGMVLNLYGLDPVEGAAEPAPPAVAVGRFKEALRSFQPIRPEPASPIAPEPALPEALGMKEMFDPESPEAFHCMEPFKTLYVRRSGEVKPCCFASGPSLGSVMSGEGLDVWQGAAFSTIRDGILNGVYSDALCGGCLKHKTAPVDHLIPALWHGYLYWHRAAHGSAGGTVPELPGNSELARRYRVRHPAPPKLEAYLDHLSRRRVLGWVWAPLQPDRRFEVSVRWRGQVFARGSASVYRGDLESAGKGDGRYSYDLTLTPPLPDEAEAPEIELVIEGAGRVLRGALFAQ